MELVCPAGNLLSLKKALHNGADAIYIGLNDASNARHFSGLNFSANELKKAVEITHRQQKKLFMAVNTYAQPGKWSCWESAVDSAATFGVDTLIAADIAVLEYASTKYPWLSLHLSVQSSATTTAALKFYNEKFFIRRAVLPRVLSLKQLQTIAQNSPCEIEVFGFGSLCIMVEGRCQLSSYLTGESPNTCGACSPARFVRWEEKKSHTEARLNNVLIDSFEAEEAMGYPTLCKGRFIVNGQRYHALEEPTSLNTLELLPHLFSAGISAIKLEGRQRSAAYVEQITRVWRLAIDKLHEEPEKFIAEQKWLDTLEKLSEGSQTTFGAYHRSWQ